MAEASPYRPFPELDLSGAAHVVAERWRRWKRSFDLYVAGQNIDDSTRKHSLLLHYAGMNTQDLFETLAEPSDPEDRYEKTVAMLNGQFKVAKNTPFERHVFRQMVPQPNEPVDKFVARLRQQARLCDFSDLNDQLRDQLVDKIAQPGLRRKLLEKDNISLDDALKICRSWEATAHQTAQMASSSSATTSTLGRWLLSRKRSNLPQMWQAKPLQQKVSIKQKHQPNQPRARKANTTASESATPRSGAPHRRKRRINHGVRRNRLYGGTTNNSCDTPSTPPDRQRRYYSHHRLRSVLQSPWHGSTLDTSPMGPEGYARQVHTATLHVRLDTTVKSRRSVQCANKHQR